MGAMGNASKKLGFGNLPESIQIDTKVHLGKPVDPATPFAVAVEMLISDSKGSLTKADIEKIAEEAHKTCPYSIATRNNLDVKITAK